MLGAAIAQTDLAEFRIEVYHGPTPLDKREAIKRAFNEHPQKHPVRNLDDTFMTCPLEDVDDIDFPVGLIRTVVFQPTTQPPALINRLPLRQVQHLPANHASESHQH